jgi:hypothetical protein
MNWLSENKDWLFSGILVSLPIAIIGWFFVSSKFINKQSQKSGDNSVNIQVGSNFKDKG